MGTALRDKLPDEIRAASESAWDSEPVQRIRLDVRDFSKSVSRFAHFLSGLIFIPLVFVIKSLIRHDPYAPYSYWYTLFGGWIVIIGGLASFLLWPIIPIARNLRKLPDPIYHELMGPLWMNLDVLNILFSASLFCYAFPSWSNPTVRPILLILLFLWLFGPSTLLMMQKDSLFIRLRVGQLALLLFVSLATVLSPVPVSHFQWWARREVANDIRPVEQEEITAGWASLQWFSQEGAPNVWFSHSDDRSYHLFSAPGYDPETNQELKPVVDKATKDLIVSSFLKKKQAQDQQMLLEQQKQLAETKAREEREKDQQLVDAKAQAERKEADTRVQLTHEYVLSNESSTVKNRQSTTVIVLNAQQEADTVLRERLSKSLSAARFVNDGPTFTEAFIASPLFRDLVAGKPASKTPFHVEDFTAHLLVVQIAFAYSPTKPVGESLPMMAADTTWGVRMISASNGELEHHFEIKERGVGFSEATARENATERAEEQLIKLVPSLGFPR